MSPEPSIKERGRLVPVVPLSMTAPQKPMPYHCTIDIPFDLPPFWGKVERWVKGDMVNAVSFDRVDLLCLGKNANGQRNYQTQTLPVELLTKVQGCVLRSLGLKP